ncbi:MAG TPA: NAD(P)H-hydrate epimerase [Gemmataceae bacterium]|jgi:NAD(P)H-hydrate epimerase|nr:NAD(P)H-hydrate epimerase [Gemmataceae bacterium]
MTAIFLSRDEVRSLDRRAMEEFGMPGIVLMENAGRGAAELLLALGIHGRVIVCCGGGNNGGDGFVMARHLDNWNVSVQVLLFTRPEDLMGDAATNYRVIEKAGLAVTAFPGGAVDPAQFSEDLARAEWVVDALFGTGLVGPVRRPMAPVLQAINAGHARVLAVDIPSGLDCDTGEATEPTIRAQHTVTFAALKKGYANPRSRDWTGQVHLVDIGVPRALFKPPPAGVPA